MSKTKNFTLYLAKSSVTNFRDALTESANDRINAGDVKISESKDLGENATAFVFENFPNPPPWLADLLGVFNGIPSFKNKSSCAVVAFQNVGRIFLIPFAHGRLYIDDSKVETDFGLRVAINSLNDSKVKRVDRSHLGEAIKGVAQSAFQRDLQAFGIDEALDLMRRVTGRIEGDDFANNLAGSTALKITREMTLKDMPDIAVEALSRFKSSAYKKTAFHIIDKVRPVLDQDLVQTLDEKAVDTIKSGKDNFELAMPGWSEEDVVYYGFKGLRIQRRYPDLLMENYRTELGDSVDTLNVDKITSKHGVFADFANDAMPNKSWSIKKALIGSITENGGLYAVNEGEWYRLEKNFKADVDDTFEQLKGKWSSPPLKIIKKVTPDGKKTGFESELEYNRRCAAAYGQICLDQEIIVVPSIPYGKFEACDLLDIQNHKLIHVKKSSRQSSVLSHFFKQGSNSARILKTYPEARKVLLQKVKKLTDVKTASDLEAALGDSLKDWTVEFHIADAPRKDGSFAIPFFSRVTLRDEVRMLKGMELKVAIKFISSG